MRRTIINISCKITIKVICSLIMCLSTGCSSFVYSYEQQDQKNKQKSKENISFQDVLVKSHRQGVDIKTKNANIVIKESKSTPDPNSIKAITEGVVEGVKPIK